MAVKIVHITRWQEVRFGDRATAEHYAVQYGGLQVWRVLTIPQDDVAAQHRTKGHHARHH